MDLEYYQLFMAITIPFFVSIFVWILTYIIPYTWPNWVSNRVISLSKNDPMDPSEITIIINQYTKYDDWKRLTAKKRLNRMFLNKVKELNEFEKGEWQLKISKVRSIPIEDLINLSETVFNYINDDKKLFTSKLIPDDNKKRFLEQKDNFIEKQKELATLIKLHPNTRIYWECNITPNFEKYYYENNFNLPIDDFMIIVNFFDQSGDYTFIDKNCSIDSDDFLIKQGDKKPRLWKQHEIQNNFNDIILYLDFPHKPSKKDEFIYRLALGLSSHNKSNETIKEIIYEIDVELYKRDYKKLTEWIK